MARFNRDSLTELYSVMERIPLPDKIKIWKMWKEANRSAPEIKIGSAEQLKLYGVVSIASVRGAIYYFRKEIFDEAPEEVLHAIIAHELSHTVASVENTSRKEEDINERVEDWGFEVLPALKWAASKFGM